MQTKKRVLIMGAAGRDFHNFNTYYRNNNAYDVVAFTATQIPNIEGRKYPKSLAGELYPNGIPIYPEEELGKLIIEQKIDEVVFSYSDVSHEYVMHKASEVLTKGAHFTLLNSAITMLKSIKPIISVCAVRTGCGKSQTTERVAFILKSLGKKTVVVRHPMPYGNLEAQAVQRFANVDDLKKYDCTIEEQEEYERHISNGFIVYAGVDYEKILRQAETEADVIIWDGGNNDTPFFKPDIEIVVVDPHRPGHELRYHPGEVNFRRASVFVVNKVNTAKSENVEKILANIKKYNSAATVICANSPIAISDAQKIKGKRVVVVEDGPTLTHGEMKYGAGTIGAENAGASEIVDPKPYAVRSIKKTFEKYPFVEKILPAMGYGAHQMKDLEETINAMPVDAVIIGTPIDLSRIISINKPTVRVSYTLEETTKPDLLTIIKERLV